MHGIRACVATYAAAIITLPSAQCASVMSTTYCSTKIPLCLMSIGQLQLTVQLTIICAPGSVSTIAQLSGRRAQLLSLSRVHVSACAHVTNH